MKRLAGLIAFVTVLSVAHAHPQVDPVQKRAAEVARAIGLNEAQTIRLKVLTANFDIEARKLFSSYRDQRQQSLFTQALRARFQNQVRQLMTPAQYAKYEGLSG